ncbi:MAG: polyprenyl synthetase family protein [Deltaproteobacteria bacterium]|nr:polyprenyl synthetase family protein [Deltaproteobacteria bacterium]
MPLGDINDYISSVKSRVDFYIEQYYSERKSSIPELLYEVINYAVFPGGKMLRPALLLGFCEEMGADSQRALPVASAIELIHTFSLIHDDLPCMDNDDFRRGKEAVHKKYTEALALLSGDALLADSFGMVAGASSLSDEIKCRIIKLISEYVGSSGMIGGQVIDIESSHHLKESDYYKLIKLKTANMFILSSLSGAICSEKRFVEEDILRFGENFGILFQYTDDIIDYSQDKKGSFNIVERRGFLTVYDQIYKIYKELVSFIESSKFNMGILRGIVDVVLKRAESAKNAAGV